MTGNERSMRVHHVQYTQTGYSLRLDHDARRQLDDDQRSEYNAERETTTTTTAATKTMDGHNDGDRTRENHETHETHHHHHHHHRWEEEWTTDPHHPTVEDVAATDRPVALLETTHTIARHRRPRTPAKDGDAQCV
jgi:hypothetical protein